MEEYITVPKRLLEVLLKTISALKIQAIQLEEEVKELKE